MNHCKSLISIITVVYNGVNALEDTMLSVLKQTYQNIEYILVDGGSKDGTVEIIRQYEKKMKLGEFPHVSLKWISEPDKGIYDAMNKGIKLATGDWVIFMNSGDLFYSDDVLDRIFKEDIGVCDVIYGDTISCLSVGRFYINAKPLNWFYNKGMAFCHQSVFVRTDVIKNNLFDLRYKIASDYRMFRHLFLSGLKFYYINQPFAVYESENGFSCVNSMQLINEQSNIIYGEEKSVVKLLYRVRHKINGKLKKILPVGMINTYNFCRYYSKRIV